MMAFPHSIRQQTLELETATEAQALALQSSLPEINRQVFLPVIERVLDELDEPGRQTRIDKLEIDLGTLPESHFEEAAAQSLERELRRVLRDTLRTSDAAQRVRVRTEAASRLELLEHCLLYGCLPFWAPRRSEVSLELLFGELAEEDPQATVRALVKLGRRPHVLDRLAAQLPEKVLERWVALLEPRHAALIVTYLDDLREAHRQEPLVAVSEPVLARELWVLTQTYLMQEPGSQFNRKSFVKSLLEGLAERRGLDVLLILETLRRGLERLETTRRVKSSLPAILGELVREVEPRSTTAPRRPRQRRQVSRSELPPAFRRYDQAAILHYFLRHGWLPWDVRLREPALTVEAVLAQLPSLPKSLMRSLFAAPSRRRRLSLLLRAVRGLSEDRLARWLERLLPRAADPRGPLRSALKQHLERAEDKSWSFARLIGAILDGVPLDLEVLAKTGKVPSVAVYPGEPTVWEVHLLKSALIDQLQPKSGASEKIGPAPTELLSVLLDHPGDARQLLHAASHRPDLRAALARECSPPLFDRVLELLAPAEAATLQAFARAVDQVPVQYRPRADKVRQALLRGVVQDRPLTARSFERWLRELFAAPLPAVAGQHLARQADTWPSAGLPPDHAQAFTLALEALSPGGAADSEPASEPGPRSAPTVVSPETVFAFLLGQTATEEAEASSGDSRSPESLSDDALRYALRTLLDDSPEDVGVFLQRHSGDRRLRERWVKILPESELVRLSYLLEPRRHRDLLDTAELLSAAWLESAPANVPSLTERTGFWSFLLEFLATHAGADRLMDRLVAAYFEHCVASYRAATPGARDSENVGSGLLERASRLARAAGQGRLVAVLHHQRSELLATWEPSTAKRSSTTGDSRRGLASDLRSSAERERSTGRRRDSIRGQTTFGLAEADGSLEEPADAIYIDNAGLVLAGAFLPHLFRELELLSEDESGQVRLSDGESASRAVHLLQILVDGRADAPEHELALNKILCGLPTAGVVDRQIEPTERERAICNKLLRSMIASWKIISSTSVAGLRDTFLQREGRLHRTPEGWRLRVQRKTLDVLVDQVPWSLSVIYHRWMPEAIHVDW